eukprot:Hpha_TRINITY_DN16603_c3_g3::TRINITY_DN16603_c3_g3_i1::g.183046::m.183046
MHLLMTSSTPQHCPGAPEEGSTVNPLFLSALPPHIQREVIEMERRIIRERQAQSSAGPAGPAEMDPATFIQTLGPDLRQEILATATSDFIRQLPPEVIAEAQTIREMRERAWARERMSLQRRTTAGREEATGGGGGGGGSELLMMMQQHQQQRMLMRGQPRQAGEHHRITRDAGEETEGAEVLTPAALPTLVKALYMAEYGSGWKGTGLRSAHQQLLRAVVRNTPSCRRIAELCLLTLSNGSAQPPADIPNAASCVRSTLLGVPPHIGVRPPAEPLKVPPQAVLRTLDALTRMNEWRPEALAMHRGTTGGGCECSFLYRMLLLLDEPVYTSSPKLGEALCKLVQGLSLRLLTRARKERRSRLAKAKRAFNKRRLELLRPALEEEEARLMAVFERDEVEAFRERPKAAERIAVAAASAAREARGESREEEPGEAERFAQELFALPKALSPLGQVLESPESTDGAAASSVAVLKELVATGIPGTAEHVFSELFHSASRAAGVAKSIRDWARRLTTAWTQHLRKEGIDPDKPGSPKKGGGSGIPQSVAQSFLASGDLLTEGAAGELHLQRLSKALRAIAISYRVSKAKESQPEDGEAEGSELEHMQGRWRAGDGRAV